MDSPTGGKVCLTLKPVKQMIITIEKKDANGSSTSKSYKLHRRERRQIRYSRSRARVNLRTGRLS